MAECIATFPENLICMTFDGGHSANVDPKMLRAQFDSGDVQQRPRQTRAVETHTATYRGSRAAIAAFRAWVRDDIHGGSSFFLWVDPLSGATVRARIVGGGLTVSAATPNMETQTVSFSIEFWA